MFVELSVILCDQLQIIMKICGAEREDKVGLKSHKQEIHG